MLSSPILGRHISRANMGNWSFKKFAYTSWHCTVPSLRMNIVISKTAKVLQSTGHVWENCCAPYTHCQSVRQNVSGASAGWIWYVLHLELVYLSHTCPLCSSFHWLVLLWQNGTHCHMFSPGWQRAGMLQRIWVNPAPTWVLTYLMGGRHCGNASRLMFWFWTVWLAVLLLLIFHFMFYYFYLCSFSAHKRVH